MGKPSSMDLRSQALAAVDEGMSCRAAARRFGVGTVMVIRWQNQRRSTGGYGAKAQGGDTQSRRIGEVRKGTRQRRSGLASDGFHIDDARLRVGHTLVELNGWVALGRHLYREAPFRRDRLHRRLHINSPRPSAVSRLVLGRHLNVPDWCADAFGIELAARLDLICDALARRLSGRSDRARAVAALARLGNRRVDERLGGREARIGVVLLGGVFQEQRRKSLLMRGVPGGQDRALNCRWVDKGFTGTKRERPGLDQALAAVRSGDTLVVPKLDRLARSVPDARAMGTVLPPVGSNSSSVRASTILATRWASCSSTSSQPSPSSRPT